MIKKDVEALKNWLAGGVTWVNLINQGICLCKRVWTLMKKILQEIEARSLGSYIWILGFEILTLQKVKQYSQLGLHSLFESFS